MNKRSLFVYLVVFWFVSGCTNPNQAVDSDIGLTLIPPGVVSDKIDLDIRAGIKNKSNDLKTILVKLYIDTEQEQSLLYSEDIEVLPESSAVVKYKLSTAGLAGERNIILVVDDNGKTGKLEKEIRIVKSDTRSLKQIDGAFLGFVHWSEEEGKYWNADLKNFTDNDWVQMMDAQKSLGMDIIVIQEVFSNSTQYAHKHNQEKEGYIGQPYYSSKLFPGRVDIPSQDPVEAVLKRADENNMYVFVGIGMYAWFDFSKASLDWHKKVADEIWEKYGHHPSFYGWYISEEQDGGLGTEEDKKNIVTFFEGFKGHIKDMTPDKPIMLATNSYNVLGAESVYEKLFRHLDILCTFGFSRMPDTPLNNKQTAQLLQQLSDKSGAHFWLDLEAFKFEDEKNALIPKTIDEITNILNNFTNFEKVICYQFPGLFSSPDMDIKPGGEPTEKLFFEYQKYYKQRIEDQSLAK